MSNYNPYAPPASPGPLTRASWIPIAVALSTFATSAFWAALGLALWGEHRNSNRAWEDGQIVIAIYVGLVFPWSMPVMPE